MVEDESEEFNEKFDNYSDKSGFKNDLKKL